MARVSRRRVPSNLKSSGAGAGCSATGGAAVLGTARGAGGGTVAITAGGFGAAALGAAGIATGGFGGTVRGARTGSGGRAGSISGGRGAVSPAPGTTTISGAAGGCGGVTAGGEATGMEAGDGAIGAVSRGCTCLLQAQPVASRQPSASASQGEWRMPPRIAPRGSLPNPGRRNFMPLPGTNNPASYWNQESSALLSHAESCFSASSLAMP